MIELLDMQKKIHENAVAKGFWNKSRSNVNLGEKLALIHSEVSEVVEELRKRTPKLQHIGEELADVVIRVLDFAEFFGIDLETEIERKHRKNLKRPPMHSKRF